MWHDNETDQDLLGFNIHADLLSELVIDDKILPITIGLFGDWGSGKSSIMKMLEAKLKNRERVVTITFNGWVFEGYDDAKTALIETILKTIIEEEKISEKGIKAAKKLLKKVNWFRIGKLGITNIGIPLAKAYATGGLSLIGDGLTKFVNLLDNPAELTEKINSEDGKKLQSELKTLIKTDIDSRNQTPKVVRNFRKEFEKTIKKCDIDSLVIMVDDLDRCTPDRIIDNLEAIKLFLNVPKTAFIIGADRRIVRHAIQHRYRANDIRDSEINDYESLVTDYLEKLIQIPYILPKLSESEVETYLTLLICQRDLNNEFERIVEAFIAFREKDKHSTFGFQNVKDVIGENQGLTKLAIIPTLAPLITEGLKGNPRQIKRFFNAYTIRQKLATVANIEDFRTDVLIKLMILEYMDNDRFQDLYKQQSIQNGHPTIIIKVEQSLDKLDDVLKEFQNWEKENIKKWLRMEPFLTDIDLRDYFWLSRDKLSVSHQSVNLVPPIVKKIYKELIEARAQVFIQNHIKSIDKTLGSKDSVEQLVKLVCDGIVRDPGLSNGHDVMFEFIKEKNQFITEYYNAIKKIPDINSIPPSIGNSLFILESKGLDISSIIELISNSKNSKAYKTYKTKKEK